MSIAAIIWLAITVVLAVFTFLGGILDVRWAFDVGACLTLVSFLGFGISLLIEYNRRYQKRVMAIQKQAQEEAAQKRAAEEAAARKKAQEEAAQKRAAEEATARLNAWKEEELKRAAERSAACQRARQEIDAIRKAREEEEKRLAAEKAAACQKALEEIAARQKAWKEEALKREAEEAAARQKAQEEREKSQALWNRHFEAFEFKVAGVTFEGRQSVLRKIYVNHEKYAENPDVTLKPYRYRGAPACHVLADGNCIGNIPAEDVEFCLSILDRVSSIDLTVDHFIPKDREDPYEDWEDDWDNRRKKPRKRLYYAIIRVTCTKPAPADPT